MRSRAILISAISHSLMTLFFYGQMVQQALHEAKSSEYQEVLGYSIGFGLVVIAMAATYGILVGVLINATIKPQQRFGPPPVPRS
ncbi:MAG: hypothetical protein HONBIEJF_01171 [Fimbriimonadaceae bacterium]|nr:hypothetical protein [Fimbriimonadaceae bacterium]